MNIRVLFFGQLRDMVGRTEDRLTLPEGSTLGTLFDHYASACPALSGIRHNIALARNQQFAPVGEPLADGDEVALLPPVSGGTDRYHHRIDDPAGHFFALTREAIDVDVLNKHVMRDEDGAVIHFLGVVRNHSGGRQTRFLDYECYEPMAIQEMARIGREVAVSHPVGRVAIVHRLGRLAIGEASVVVVVGSPHRRAAFDAALECINRLKTTVPIWKKEYFVDGEVWVEGEWDAAVPRS